MDAAGKTLYYFAKDTIGKSNATAAIIASWPVFNATNITLPPSLNVADFSTITRDDGTQQTTYRGWPLYYYAKDTKAGDMLGDGLNGKGTVLQHHAAQ